MDVKTTFLNGDNLYGVTRKLCVR